MTPLLGSLTWRTRCKNKPTKCAKKPTVSTLPTLTFPEMQHDGELKYFKDMASFVKSAMEEKYEGTCWHVIVGTNFGSFVSYEHKSINLFWLEHIGFLLWRHG